MGWGSKGWYWRGRPSGRRRASLASVLLCLLTWMPLPLGLSSAHAAAGWTPVCTGEGARTVLVEDSGDQTKHQGSYRCAECWGQAPQCEVPVLAGALEVFDVVADSGDDFAVRAEIFPRTLFRFQTRSRAPPASA